MENELNGWADNVCESRQWPGWFNLTGLKANIGSSYTCPSLTPSCMFHQHFQNSSTYIKPLYLCDRWSPKNTVIQNPCIIFICMFVLYKLKWKCHDLNWGLLDFNIAFFVISIKYSTAQLLIFNWSMYIKTKSNELNYEYTSCSPLYKTYSTFFFYEQNI